MVMTSAQRKQKERGKTGRLAGRNGHRVVRLSDSMFVVGGVDTEGLWVNQIHRINQQSSRLDSLIMDTGLSLEGFSLFSLQENLYLWGGCTYSENSNQLLQFEGSKFLTLRQQGSIPSARTDHLSVSFGSKYLIVFGGRDHHQFFSDWNLLNISNFKWTRLTPSLELPPCSGGQMVWLSGRGILLLNDFFDQTLNVYFPNRLFQFYVSDFSRGCLKLVPVALPPLKVFTNFIFSSMLAYDRDSVLFLGGYRYNQLNDVHNLAFRFFPEDNRCQQLFLSLPKALGFQPIIYKGQLYYAGGQAVGEDPYDGLFTCPLPDKAVSGYKRHVCQMCKLYFDEEWLQSTKQIYQDSIIRDEYDYNYRMRIDNRVLERLASYIREDFYAFTMVLATLKDMGAQEIEASLQKIKDLSTEPNEQTYQYLKVGCVISDHLLEGILNEFLMDQLEGSGSVMVDEALSLSQLTLRLKLGSFRLGKSTLVAARLSEDQVMVIYYSSSQLECTSTNFSPFPSYTYVYNSKTKTSNCPILRGLVHQNIKPIFPHHQDYQELNQNNLSVTFFCGEELEAELTLCESSVELETGQSSIVASHKEENKRTIPLMQLAFLPQEKLPPIQIQHTPLKLYNLEELLEGDSSNDILEPVQLQGVQVSPETIQKAVLFIYPEEYWFKRIMVYHSGRLISHFKEPENRLCGVIQLHPQVPLDLGGTNLARLEDKRIVEHLLHDVRSLKRAPSD